MNVFENLIDELKEENLLEETVTESRQTEDDEYLGEVKTVSSVLNHDGSQSEHSAGTNLLPNFDSHNNALSANLDEISGELSEVDFRESAANEPLIVGNSEIITDAAQAQHFPVAEEEIASKTEFDEKEFYRRRAIEEVSGLQMVEHVLSGIEREQIKSLPKNYNDITAKKALHDFLQLDADVKSPEHAQAEFHLMQGTETWCSALSHRDKRISVAHLRRYCEMTKPVLSSQALISLARFYRNLPYSEAVRSKFDFVVTKLFSKDDGNEKRVLVFSREELIAHLKALYAEWSSISLYSADDDDSSIVLAALKSEDFMSECENADSFDELIKTDFFNRLRSFKESTDEVFFAPLVTAAAIECNARIGNRYVDLIRAERTKNNIEDLQDKYGFTHDQVISDATSKTHQLVELLREKVVKPNPAKTGNYDESEQGNEKDSAKFKFELTAAPKKVTPEKESRAKSASGYEKKSNSRQSKFFSVSKWLLATTIIIVLVNVGLYLYVYHGAAPVPAAANIKKVNLENSSLQEFLTSARISGETFYGVTLPSWASLSNDKKEEVLKKIISFGSDKGFSKAHLLDKDGKTVGFASREKVEVINP